MWKIFLSQQNRILHKILHKNNEKSQGYRFFDQYDFLSRYSFTMIELIYRFKTVIYGLTASTSGSVEILHNITHSRNSHLAQSLFSVHIVRLTSSRVETFLLKGRTENILIVTLMLNCSYKNEL